jgi:RHS Repeat
VYDANGNTVNSGGIGDVYDFENRLVQQGGATMVYDGNGNRVQKTVAGVTTKFLISDINPTGYPQVVYEAFSGRTGNREEFHLYVYGLDRISQNRVAFINSQNINQTNYYVYDGHGSVRALTDPNGNVTDTYDYDAFGNEIHTSTTPWLQAGENVNPVQQIGGNF